MTVFSIFPNLTIETLLSERCIFYIWWYDKPILFYFCFGVFLPLLIYWICSLLTYMSPYILLMQTAQPFDVSLYSIFWINEVFTVVLHVKFVHGTLFAHLLKRTSFHHIGTFLCKHVTGNTVVKKIIIFLLSFGIGSTILPVNIGKASTCRI